VGSATMVYTDEKSAGSVDVMMKKKTDKPASGRHAKSAKAQASSLLKAGSDGYNHHHHVQFPRVPTRDPRPKVGRSLGSHPLPAGFTYTWFGSTAARRRWSAGGPCRSPR
jgi:hypothetical protein